VLKLNLKLKKEQNQLLLLLFLVVVGLGWFGFNQLQKIKGDFLLLNNLIIKQSNKLNEISLEVEQLQKVNEEGLAKLEIELLSEKEKRFLAEEKQTAEKELAQKQFLNLEEKITEAEKNGLTNIVNQWGPYVVALECNFYLAGTKELFLQSSGSGLLTNWGENSVVVLTNKHIVTALSIGQDNLSNECTIKFPQKGTSVVSKNISVLSNVFDWGLITLDFPSDYVKALLQSPPRLCSTDPVLGDEVVILGYPGIGDQKNVTATEGIVAGFDEDYFITSAKVEKGNSGGAAISLKNNCYLGTPTFSRTGEIESLARILDVRVLK